MKAKQYGKQMPKSEARPLGTKKASGKKNLKIVQKKVDTVVESEVESIQQSEPQAIQQAAGIDQTAAKEQQTMTLTLKTLSKNGKRAIYTGALQSINFALGLFPDKTAPASIEIADGVFAVKAEKVAKAKLSKEERAALPRPTLAEKIARREELLARDKAKLAAASAM